MQTAIQSHYALITSLAAVTIILLMVILFCYIKKVLRENRDRFGAPSNNPIINLLTPNITREYRPVSERRPTPVPQAVTASFDPVGETVQISPQPAPRM